MKRKTPPEVILALDVDTLRSAQGFLRALYPHVKIFKVGSHLFTTYGSRVVKLIHAHGAEVFLDLKYFDIPHTVSQAVRAATRLKVKMLTLHISGGPQMLRAAVEAAADEAKKKKISRPRLIGVTVLTSQEASPAQVVALAKTGIACGLDGVVCSAREAALLRKKIKRDFLIITPGIRPDKSVQDDQKRTVTVKEARKAGSNFLVIGRPILKAADPLAAAQELLKDIRA